MLKIFFMKTSKLLHLVCAAALFILISVNSFAQTITTIAGCGIGDDSLATRAELDRPVAVAMPGTVVMAVAGGIGRNHQKTL